MVIGRWMDKEGVVHIHNGILLSHKKERIWVSSSKVNDARACCTEQSKSEREKQILYINTYIWNLEKLYWQTYLQHSNGNADIENRLRTQQGKERAGWTERVELTYMHYRVWNRHKREVAVSAGNSAWCSGTTQMDGMGAGGWVWGRFKREGTYTHDWFMLLYGKN